MNLPANVLQAGFKTSHPLSPFIAPSSASSISSTAPEPAVRRGNGGGTSSPLLCAAAVGGPPRMAIERLAGGTLGGVAAPIEGILRSDDPSTDVVGESGAPSRLGFFGLMGGAGLRCTAPAAADATDETERTEGDGDSDGRADEERSSFAVPRRGGSCGLPFASKAGGSLRGTAVLEAADEERVTFADDATLSTCTQSGSSLGTNGLGEREGFGT